MSKRNKAKLCNIVENGQIWKKGIKTYSYVNYRLLKQSKWYELKLNNLKCFQTHDRYGQAMKIAKTSPGRFVIWFGKNLISPLQKMNAGPARKL